MKTLYSIVHLVGLMFLVNTTTQGQSTIYYENFNSGTAAEWSLNTRDLGCDTANQNFWTVNNIYTGDAVAPYVETDTQPVAITGAPRSYYMHINNAENNPLLASEYQSVFYAPAAGNIFTKMNTPISTTGYSGVSLSFYYISYGLMNKYFGRLYYSIDGGSTWIEKDSFAGVRDWTLATVTDANFNNQADLRFAFMWVQNNYNGMVYDPALGVDEIKLDRQ